MKLYKLTKQNGTTHNNTLWGPNITHEATGDIDQPLCSNAWLHAYESPELAILMNPAHANIILPRLWEAEGEIGVTDGTKCGCRKLTTIREIPLPIISHEQRIAFAILVALAVYKNDDFAIWANKWLAGTDRSARAAARAASNAASASVAYASTAYTAAYAANAYAYADAASSAYVAAYAYAAAYAADAASINFVALAKKAIEEY